jgi:hypothetical protein
MFGRRVDATYRRSQSATGLPVRPSVIARGLALGIVDSSDDHVERRKLGQLLLDELDALAGLPHCDLVVADRAQVHAHNGQRLQSKTYGYYRCAFEDGAVKGARIRIYHRTAVRQQVISPKVFLNTLLHEWTHHYDFAGLHLPRSPHTSGFYTRLRVLAEALEVSFVMPPEPGQTATTAPSAA